MATTAEELFGNTYPQTDPALASANTNPRSLQERVFDFKGHNTLYAKISGGDGQPTELAYLQGTQRDGIPFVEGFRFTGNFMPAPEELHNLIEVEAVALPPTDGDPFVPLHRELAGQTDIDWVPARRIICIPVPVKDRNHTDFRLRAVPAPPEADDSHEDLKPLLERIRQFPDHWPMHFHLLGAVAAESARKKSQH